MVRFISSDLTPPPCVCVCVWRTKIADTRRARHDTTVNTEKPRRVAETCNDTNGRVSPHIVARSRRVRVTGGIRGRLAGRNAADNKHGGAVTPGRVRRTHPRAGNVYHVPSFIVSRLRTRRASTTARTASGLITVYDDDDDAVATNGGGGGLWTANVATVRALVGSSGRPRCLRVPVSRTIARLTCRRRAKHGRAG